MNPRPITFWIALLAITIALATVLREILLPFVAGMTIAYLLDPLATRLQRLGFNRLWATLTLMALFVMTVVGLVFLTAPVIIREVSYFIDNVPIYLEQLRQLASAPGRPWLTWMVGEGLSTAERSFSELTTLAASWFSDVLRSAWSGGAALLSIFSLAIVTPVTACYLIYDWSRMIAAVDNWVPPASRETVRMLARQIDDTIGGFVRGQGALCLILGIFYGAALGLIGLKHGILIGFAAGLASFIPYLGSLTGLLVASFVAVAQFWPRWGMISLVPSVFVVGQLIGDYVLSPYLVGRRVHLNPVWVMFALFAFGYLFGFVGLLIAVPLAAAIGVLLRFSLAQYYASPLYAAEPSSISAPHSVADEAE
jgi:predicted PurR-regulated permease PerM